MARSALPYPLLIIDTSAPSCWAGVKLGPSHLAWREKRGDPADSLYDAIGGALNDVGIELAQLASLAFCEGPGSMLGARAASMTIRAWEGIGLPAARQLHAYTSLSLASFLLERSAHARGAALLVADARRDTWAVLRHPADPAEPAIELLDSATLDSAAAETPVFSMEGFPVWTRPPSQLRTTPYDRAAAFGDDAFLDRLRPTQSATPLALREGDYRKWTPRVHTAPQRTL